jgi:hypothetical protein
MLMTLMIKSVSQPVCRDAGQNGEEKQFFTFDVLPTALSDRCYRMPSSAYHQVVHDMIEEKDRHINNHLCALGYRGVSTYDIFSIFREYAWVRFHTSRGIDTSISQVAEKLEMDKFVVRVVVYSLSDGTSTHGFIHRSIMDYLIAQAIISRTEPRDLKDAFFTVINSRISEHIANSLVSKIAADREGHDPIEYSIGPFLDCMKCCDGMDDTFRRMNILYIIGKFMMAATESNSVSAKRAGLWVKDHLQRLYSEYSNDGEKEKRGECFVILYVLVESGVGDYEQDLLGMFDEDPDIVRISYGAFKGDIPFRAALEQREIEGMRLDNVIPEILNASNSSNPRHLNMKGFLTRLLKSYQDNGYQIPEEFENDVSDLIGNNNNMNETIRNQSVLQPNRTRQR